MVIFKACRDIGTFQAAAVVACSILVAASIAHSAACRPSVLAASSMLLEKATCAAWLPCSKKLDNARTVALANSCCESSVAGLQLSGDAAALEF